MVKTKCKTGFLGFLVAMKSVKCLFNKLVGNTNVSMTDLLAYKLSQYHLELFFAAIRSSGGWNNNPTATQFMAAYKRLLLRHKVSASGNYTALDATNILHAVKDTTTINHVNADSDVSDITTIRRYDLTLRLEPQQTDHDYVDAPNFYSSSYKEAAVGYIAGFVVIMVKRSVTCESCIDALVEKDPNDAKFNSLVKHKNHGGLIEASASVYQICQSTQSNVWQECLIQQGETYPHHQRSSQLFYQWSWKKLSRKMHSHLSTITCLTALLTTTTSSG